jgi:hypothetical protein
LSLTIITENGSVQDMTLMPIERDAATIVLTGHSAGKSAEEPREEIGFDRDFNPNGYAQQYTQRLHYFQNAVQNHSLSLKNQLVRAMKALITGRLPEVESDNTTRKEVEGFDLDYKQSHQVGPLKGLVFEVKNTTTTPIEIDERQFYSTGDLALSFEKRLLNPQETTNFYILVSDDQFTY